MTKIIVVGDVHGDLNQLMYPLVEFLRNEDKYRKLIFLGDYIDRGESNLYIYGIIKFMMSLNRYTNKIVFLRGNHECYRETVLDWFGEDNKKRFNSTFVFDSINKEVFDIVHYDQDLKIVFSHSPLSRPLEQVLAMNTMKTNIQKCIENTFTDDKESTKMEYRNIHGHTHQMSMKSRIDGFVKGENKMISIDGDASYGITLVNNIANLYVQKKKLISRVRYLILDDDKCDVIEHEIMFNDYERNYNVFKFDMLKEQLKKCNNYMMNQIVGFKFSDMLSIWVKEFRKVFRTEPNKNNIRELIKKGFENKSKGSGVVIYFNDTPADVFNSFGLFKDEEYNEMGKLFMMIIDKLDLYKPNYLVGLSGGKNESFQVGNESRFKLVLLIVMMIVVVVLVASCVIVMMRRKKQMNVDGESVR